MRAGRASRWPRPAVLFALSIACVAAAGASAAAGGAVRLAVVPRQSSLTFTIHRPGETIDGAAREFSGEVVLDPADPGAGGSVVLSVAAASLETGNRIRDRKMRRAHLEVERFPAIVFRSTSIQVGPAREGTSPAPGAARPAGGPAQRKALVEGILSLHGADRSVLVPAAIRYDNGLFTADGSVVLTYSDYGIPIPRFLWLLMDDEIQVRFHIVAGSLSP